jgi:hypothetical protein
MLVGVVYQEANRASCRLSFKHTTQQFHLVSLFTGCRNVTLSWFAPVQFLLDELQVNGNACRHPVYDATDGFSMTFAKGCQPKYVTKRIHYL